MGLAKRLAAKGVLVADGAMGTWLLRAGLPAGTPPELWNVERPQAIVEAHRAYVGAGADIILTNTFGGSPRKMARSGLEGRAEELNRAAVALARQAAEASTLVAGDIGPTGDLMAPLGSLSREAALAGFALQTRWLAESGVDCILIETMADLEEAAAAVEGARSATELPVICTMSFDSHGRTMMGVRPRQMAERLWALGAIGLGTNCGRSLAENAAALGEVGATQPQAILWTKPNAGLPHLEGGHTVYDVGPAEFAQAVMEMVAQGAAVVGGCCGTTPEHIAALRQAVDRRVAQP